MKYRNPVIPGFYPDPSICRVGEDYYLVNSSFEYFPGVPVFHSRDLVNWRQIGHCLTRRSQLPLEGAAPSDGIYAPTIRHHGGRFYMVTTNALGGSDFRNFYVHTEDPAGEWSEPVWVGQKGIDPSLFFDDDGKVYLTGNGTLWAPVRGAYQSEIDIATGRHLTDIKFIWPGTGGAYPEAPHLFKRDGQYYLMMAEGGTAEGHSVTISRSKDPWGPFEPCPHNPILTTRGLMNDIQATGHADFVEDHRGNWWAVFLGIRFADGVHQLGRETFLAPVRWTGEGWPVVNDGNRILTDMETDKLPAPHPWPAEPVRDDFDAAKLRLCWVFLRNPNEEDWSITDRPGWLRLRCSPVTIDDVASPAFLGRRQTHFDCHAATLVDFTPRGENEEAGLAALIDNKHHYSIAITVRGGKRVAVVRRRIGSLVSETAGAPLPDGPIVLSIRTDRRWYEFGFSVPDGAGTVLARGESRYLSSEVAGGYTGVCLGVYATSRGAGSDNAAHFDWFDYEPLS
jgi:alpha-N-arabinofuranosidase